MTFLADEVRQAADFYFFLGLPFFCLVIGGLGPLASMPP